MDEDITDLLLAGYVPLRSQGLALPCYASGPQSNAWYCAVCSVDGDHTGAVVAFEPFEAVDIVRLPEGAHRAVSIGDPWHDVLLWGDAAHVGTPGIIVEQLGDTVAQLAATAPLTLLDLAMASDTLDRAALARTAYTHLRGRWGRDEADRWQSENFVRQRLLVEARRILSDLDAADTAGIIRELEVIREPDGLRVDVPYRLRHLLAAHRLSGAFSDRISALAAETGIALALPAELREVDAQVSQDIPPPSERDPGSAREELDIREDRRVLIVVSGPRARLLAKHVRPPDWLPDWQHGDEAGARSPLEGRAGLTPFPEKFDIIDDRDGLPLLGGHDVLIWVVDDEVLVSDQGRNVATQINRSVAPDGRPLVIIAPTLPAQHPPVVLADPDALGDLSDFRTILDTSIVRSPFWPGNPRRSIDRRVADLISATAQLLGVDSPLLAWLTEDRPRYDPLLLSIASGAREDRTRLTLASEVSSADLVPGRDHERRSERFSWTEMPVGGERSKILRGEALVRKHEPEFATFAETVIARGFDRRIRAEPGSTGDMPSSISDCLRFPHLSATFLTDDNRDQRICVISAEAPSLKALRAAASSGWTIARYSDNEALRASPGRARRLPLPSDIAMPELNRLGRNRGLAVRGVDPRDVIRVRRDIFNEWLQMFRHSDLAAAVRWYRSSVNRHGEPPESNEFAALPVSTFLRAEEDGDDAARFLRDHDEVETPSPGALAKRTADLRASWAEPARGTWRVMIEDGRLPVRLGPVDAEEVAAQKFFTIDGDESVPLLFSSRLFQVWAIATLTRSPSWSSRFSITRTFETFPIPDEFLVIGDGEGGRASLRINPKSRELSALVKDLDIQELISDRDHAALRRARASRGHDPEFSEFDAVVLERIGLSPDAADLDVLERMVEMNRNAGT